MAALHPSFPPAPLHSLVSRVYLSNDKWAFPQALGPSLPPSLLQPHLPGFLSTQSLRRIQLFKESKGVLFFPASEIDLYVYFLCLEHFLPTPGTSCPILWSQWKHHNYPITTLGEISPISTPTTPALLHSTHHIGNFMFNIFPFC